MVWPFFAIEVAGESMLPTFHPGDWLLCRRTQTVKPGQIVVIDLPEVGLVVKRLQDVADKGTIWVVGDNPNPAASTDSRTWGWLDAAQVWGRVVLQYRRGKH